MIETRRLRKKYGSFEALKGVSFEVEEGQVFSLLGSNGAGKTTIIKIITGLLEATSGKAYIDGKEMDGSTEIKKIFGYMPEQPHLYDRLTGREFLQMMASLRGMDKEVVNSRIDEMGEELELRDKLDSEMGAYSKGMKQKILFANAVIHDPPNFILDEPTSGLDPRFTRYLKDKIREMADNGKTVLMSTHITSVAADVSDEIGVINEGNLIARGTPQDMMKDTETSTLEDVFIEVVNDD